LQFSDGHVKFQLFNPEPGPVLTWALFEAQQVVHEQIYLLFV